MCYLSQCVNGSEAIDVFEYEAHEEDNQERNSTIWYAREEPRPGEATRLVEWTRRRHLKFRRRLASAAIAEPWERAVSVISAGV
jgi:hypothetical protein